MYIFVLQDVKEVYTLLQSRTVFEVVFYIANCGYVTHLGIEDLLSESDIPNSEIHNPQMDKKYTQCGNKNYLIADNILNWVSNRRLTKK